MCPSVDKKKSPKSIYQEEAQSSSRLWRARGGRGYLIHYDTGARTSEGFGSHARASLFPLIHIAATLGLQPLFCNDGLHENTARDYSELDVASFLGLGLQLQQEEEQQGESCTTTTNNNVKNRISALESACSTVLYFSTWTDRTIGSACGDAIMLGEILKDYLYSNSIITNNRDDGDDKQRTQRTLLLCLTGSFRYMNPTPPVLDYLQKQSLQWKNSSSRPRLSSVGQPTNDDVDVQDKIQIVAHVRVPEDFCPQFWKDCNSIDNVLKVLDLMEASLCRILLARSGGRNPHDDSKASVSSLEFHLETYADIAIVTEQAFSIQDEQLVLSRFPTTRIHRGTPATLLQDVQRLATSDVLIPASSHLSALAGYMTHGVIFLPDDASRLDYFQPLVDLQEQQQDDDASGSCSSVIFAANDNPKFHEAMQKLLHYYSRPHRHHGTVSSSTTRSAADSSTRLDLDGSSSSKETSDNRRVVISS